MKQRIPADNILSVWSERAAFDVICSYMIGTSCPEEDNCLLGIRRIKRRPVHQTESGHNLRDVIRGTAEARKSKSHSFCLSKKLTGKKKISGWTDSILSEYDGLTSEGGDWKTWKSGRWCGREPTAALLKIYMRHEPLVSCRNIGEVIRLKWGVAKIVTCPPNYLNTSNYLLAMSRFESLILAAASK